MAMADAATTLTAARTLLQAWRDELHDGHVNRHTGQVDDVDTARDIAEIDRVVEELESFERDVVSHAAAKRPGDVA